MLRAVVAGVLMAACITSPIVAQENNETKVVASFQDWVHARYEDPFRENTGSAALTRTDSGERMSVMCYDSGMKVLSLEISEFLGLSMEDVTKREVKYVFDDGDINESEWVQIDAGVTGSQIALARSLGGREFNRFLTDAKESRYVRFRVYDYEGDSSDHRFSLLGFSDALDAACGL